MMNLEEEIILKGRYLAVTAEMDGCVSEMFKALGCGDKSTFELFREKFHALSWEAGPLKVQIRKLEQEKLNLKVHWTLLVAELLTATASGQEETMKDIIYQLRDILESLGDGDI